MTRRAEDQRDAERAPRRHPLVQDDGAERDADGGLEVHADLSPQMVDMLARLQKKT